MTRLDKAKAKLMSCDFDAIYITSEINQRYITDFNFSDGSVLITKEKSYVLTDFRYIEAARAKVKGDFEILTPNRRENYLLDLCRENHVETLAVEEGSISYAQYISLGKRLEGIKLTEGHGFIEDLRIHKDASEVADIVAAQRIAEKAFAELLPMIKAGVTETELALELEYKMRRHGASDISFETICVSGSASALPHGEPRPVPIEKGFLTFDFGAVVNGYHSDMTRTVVIGKADEDIKHLYNTVLHAQVAAIEAVTEGASNAEIDKIARDIIDNAGYAGRFGHGLGHGVGLQIHEAPSLSAYAGDSKLEVGHIVTVEPGIYIEGKYGCRIEDMVEIIPGGARNLTECPKELIEIEI